MRAPASNFSRITLRRCKLKGKQLTYDKVHVMSERTAADAHYQLWCSVLKKENFSHSLGSKSPISGELCENSSWCIFFSQYMYLCHIGKVEGSPFFSITAGASCVRRTGSPCACVCVEPVCFLFWVAGSLREQHSKVTAMRSSACVVMATKAVAALLRNKMAGMVVSLSLLLLLLLATPPLLFSFFLVSVNWSTLVVTPSTPLPAPHPALTLFCSLFCPPHLNRPFTLHACESAWAGFEWRSCRFWTLLGWCFWGFSVLHTVKLLNQLVESADEKDTNQQV